MVERCVSRRYEEKGPRCASNCRIEPRRACRRTARLEAEGACMERARAEATRRRRAREEESSTACTGSRNCNVLRHCPVASSHTSQGVQHANNHDCSGCTCIGTDGVRGACRRTVARHHYFGGERLGRAGSQRGSGRAHDQPEPGRGRVRRNVHRRRGLREQRVLRRRSWGLLLAPLHHRRTVPHALKRRAALQPARLLPLVGAPPCP
jgi:hypothetical protein